MNKFKVISIVVLGIIIFAALFYAKKQWFDDGSVFTTSTINADKVSRLAAAGGDMRLYEFTPETAPYMQCVFVAGNNKGSAFCFEKRDYVGNNQKQFKEME